MRYDSYGNEVEAINEMYGTGEVHSFDEVQNRGRQPDFTKEDLLGEEIIVRGISGPEEFPLGLAYFILIQRKSDKPNSEPWGVMFPASSPVITTALSAVRQKKLPFRAVLERTTSEANPDRQYWHFRR